VIATVLLRCHFASSCQVSPTHQSLHLSASLQGCLNEVALSSWRRIVKQAILVAEGQLTKKGIAVSQNEIFTFQEIAARGKHRFDLKLDMAAPCMEQMRTMLDAAPWIGLVELLLGKHYSVLASVVYSQPGADVQVRALLHSDVTQDVQGLSAVFVLHEAPAPSFGHFCRNVSSCRIHCRWSVATVSTALTTFLSP
jgi:hypothetical protein